MRVTQWPSLATAATIVLAQVINAQSQNQTRLLDLNQADWPTIPSTCFSVLTQTVNCAPVLIWTRDLGGGMTRFYTDESLSNLCTTACTSGLTAWHRRVVGACANVRVSMSNSSDTLTWVAQWAQEYLEAYSSTCLKDNSGQLCNSVLRSVMKVNPTNQAQTATPSSTAVCNSCFLSVLSTQLAMPLGAEETRLSLAYQAATSKCGSTAWTMPSPAKTTWDVSGTAGPGPEPTCAGKTVTLSGQTCQEVSTSNGISTRSLLMANGLSGDCYGFPQSGTLCIPNKSVCKTYTVKQGDTCRTIGSANGVTKPQLISWNPELGMDCSSFDSVVGEVICISNPGGDWVNPDPPPPPVTTTFESIPSMPGMMEMTSLPEPTRIGWNNSIEVAPYANDTRLDCSLYAQPPILQDWASDTYTSDCKEVAAGYNIALDDFLSWNPSLKTDCTLKSDRQYCVSISNDTVPDTNEFCAEFAFAYPGRGCDAFIATHGLEMAQFTTWNPVVGQTCEGFKTGLSYCVNVYKFRQPGIVSTCNKFAVANNSRWADSPCKIIESKFGIEHPRFVAWNPAVKQNCTGLYRNYEYCVSIPGFRPTFPTTAAAPQQT